MQPVSHQNQSPHDLLDTVTYRQPLLTDKALVADESPIHEDWSHVMQAARIALRHSGELRDQFSQYTTEPLSEAIPDQAVSMLIATDPAAALIDRQTDSRLRSFLAIDPVPDELLRPDIKNAPAPVNRESLERSIDGMSDEQAVQHVMNIAEDAKQNPGVGEAEKWMVASRYRYARDIKLLALGSEQYATPLSFEPSGDGTVGTVTKSGVKLVMTEGAAAEEPALLDPLQWEGREKLKDRVFLVTINDKPYIMKERKTPYHTDQRPGGYQETRTSETEFTIARTLASQVPETDGDITVNREQPLAYAEFPDGYQFCMFGFEPDLIVSDLDNTHPERPTPTKVLADRIMSAPEAYHDEYLAVREAAERLVTERPDLFYTHQLPPKQNHSGRRLPSFANWRTRTSSAPAPSLSFEEFAPIQAYYALIEASARLRETEWREGYYTSDHDGYGFHFAPSGPSERVPVEIIGFDYEYHRYDPAWTNGLITHNQELKRDGSMAQSLYRTSHNVFVQAASYAIMERFGIKLPPKRVPPA